MVFDALEYKQHNQLFPMYVLRKIYATNVSCCGQLQLKLHMHTFCSILKLNVVKLKGHQKATLYVCSTGFKRDEIP
jgi:hypothetical protein